MSKIFLKKEVGLQQTINKMKRYKKEKIFTNYISDKELISKYI